MGVGAFNLVNGVGAKLLAPSVIQRKISQSAIYRSRWLTVATTLRQQGSDVWHLLEQAWIAHHRGVEDHPGNPSPS